MTHGTGIGEPSAVETKSGGPLWQCKHCGVWLYSFEEEHACKNPDYRQAKALENIAQSLTEIEKYLRLLCKKNGVL